MKRSLLPLVTFAGVFAPSGMVLLAQDSTAAQIAAAAASTVVKKPGVVTLLEAIESGGWAMIPLAIMSVLTVMLIFAYAITLRRNAVVSPHFMNTAEVLLQKQDYPGLLAIANRHSESIARVIRRMLDFASKNPSASFEIIREIAQTEGSAQAASLQHRITYLADIAVLSPMVGLLGTVIGIIRSFATIANSASEASRSGLLSGGVSEALFATATGLIVGIVSMAFYGIFRNRVQSLISELEMASAQLLAMLAVNFSKQNEKREDRRETRREEDRERSPAPARRAAVSVDDEL